MFKIWSVSVSNSWWIWTELFKKMHAVAVIQELWQCWTRLLRNFELCLSSSWFAVWSSSDDLIRWLSSCHHTTERIYWWQFSSDMKHSLWDWRWDRTSTSATECSEEINRCWTSRSSYSTLSFKAAMHISYAWVLFACIWHSCVWNTNYSWWWMSTEVMTEFKNHSRVSTIRISLI